MSALRDQQQGFARVINGGIGGDNGECFAQTIRNNGLSGERRLTIYHRGVVIGFRDALAGVYAVVKKLVGDEFFDYVANHYLRKHPSHTGNVHDFGEAFPQFLASFPALESLPYLPHVARFEWLYHTVFHSPMSEMLNIERLSLVPESKYGHLNLLFSPACCLFSSEYPVLRIWQANQENHESNEMISLDEGGVQLAIVREGNQIVFHSLEPATFAMLDAISRNVKFDQACEAALKVDPNCDVGLVLQEVVMNRMVVGFAVNE